MKLNKRLFIFLLFTLLFVNPGYSQNNVIITGNAPSYNNETLQFCLINDFITDTELPILQFKVGPDGNFSCSVNLGETSMLSIELGVYKGLLFTEPGKTYRLILPPKTAKSTEDRINPYFKPSQIYLEIQDKDNEELNDQIRQFDNCYDSLLYTEVLHKPYHRLPKNMLDSIITNFDKRYNSYRNQYFKDYRQYKYGFIKLVASHSSVQSILKEYFSGMPVLFTNPSYMYLFNQLFNKASCVYNTLNGAFPGFWENLKTNAVNSVSENKNEIFVPLSDTLKELIAVKSLYNSFYDKTWPAKDLKQVLDSVTTNSKIIQIRLIAKNFIEKSCALAVNSDAPFFELTDRDNQHVKLTDLKGKYIYLNFCTFWSLPCNEQFGLLNKIHHDHGDQIEVVTIIGDGDYRNFIDNLSQKDYNWTFLHFGEDPDIINKYRVLVFPTYYLIDPYGKLVMSPAPSPGENFEGRFGELMRWRN